MSLAILTTSETHFLRHEPGYSDDVWDEVTALEDDARRRLHWRGATHVPLAVSGTVTPAAADERPPVPETHGTVMNSKARHAK